MLKNFWYACELSSAVTERPRKVKVLGQEIVIYRKEGGRVVAMSDRCVHRGGSLAGGAVVGGCIRCPYHGWRFDADGACVEIPANPRGAPVPKKARTDAYPTEERYGFVWVFLGDLAESERPPIPPLDEASRPGWRAVYGEFEWNANYSRVVENGLDFAHGPFVHTNSFGNINRPEIPDYEVVSSEYGASATASFPAAPPRGIWKYLSRKERPNVPVTISFFMPNVLRIHIRISPTWETIVFDANIPVDETKTRTLWVSLRNFFTGGWADANVRKGTLQVFREDGPIVEGIRPVRPPSFDAAAELPVKSDQFLLAYRRLQKKYLDMGWGIDLDKARADPSLESSVIPSPARRSKEDGARAWVFPEVPAFEPPRTTGAE